MDDVTAFFQSFDFLSNLLFGAISAAVGFLIYIVDRRGNKRQEEALDIILDQVSKVNQFQTRSLVLAINTLENELNDIKQMVSSNKEILQGSSEVTKRDFSPIPQPVTAGSSTASQQPGLGELISNKFTEVISGQVNNLFSGIQSNLDELKTSKEKESYKKKKGLEFDLKSLIRNLEGLEDLKINIDPYKTSVNMESPSSVSEDTIIEPEIVDPVGFKLDSTKKSDSVKTKLEDFEEKLGSIKSVSDIESIVDSISSMFSPKKNRKSRHIHTPKKRRKVNPEDIKKDES
ncbi:MAG: hypothetical protein HeimC3_41220 [Candidatus Heimdallarchaeota archaeon LC_3]|nr:MAG: hypothetical protein HeimC3_41220 [Candidatus Heimdallarchaeota archaeon LC_3]